MIVNPFPNKPWFLRVRSTSLMKTLWEKEKLLGKSNFPLSRKCFLLELRTLCHLHLIQNCCLQTLSVWDGLKYVVWERVKHAESWPMARSLDPCHPAWTVQLTCFDMFHRCMQPLFAGALLNFVKLEILSISTVLFITTKAARSKCIAVSNSSFIGP